MSSGIIYIASGHGFYVRQAMLSAYSAKKLMNVSITLFTDNTKYARNAIGKYKIDPFDDIISTPTIEREYYGAPFLVRLMCLKNTPYTKTLAIDADTAFNKDITHVFTMLDQFDLCLCHDHLRNFTDKMYPDKIPHNIPASFPNMCGGILFYSSSGKTYSFIDSYINLYKLWYRKFKIKLDQLALRQTLWKNKDIRYYILPGEYNVSSYSRECVKEHRIYHFINSRYFKPEEGKLSQGWFMPLVDKLGINGKSVALRRKKIKGGYKDD